ncbi:MAG: hypothetical protein ACJASO_002512, partial [Cyclobacteriaceae bacterium]
VLANYKSIMCNSGVHKFEWKKFLLHGKNSIGFIGRLEAFKLNGKQNPYLK